MQAKHAAAVEGSAASPIPGTDENQNHHKVVSGYVNSLFFTSMKLFGVLLFFFNVPKVCTKGQLFLKGNLGIFKSTKTFLVRISALASKKRSTQKSRVRESK